MMPCPVMPFSLRAFSHYVEKKKGCYSVFDVRVCCDGCGCLLTDGSFGDVFCDESVLLRNGLKRLEALPEEPCGYFPSDFGLPGKEKVYCLSCYNSAPPLRAIKK